ncbi:MAG TPA: protein kinase [Pyrinomonadaceae bacterium]|nr:protein kinase [Pyrinomonadaceae bacterium]
MLASGLVLQNRYRVIKQLGQGGMGAVYEAIDERLDTTIALKETLFSDERLRRQFEREARLLARMHHPALPRVSDHFSEGDGQFLAMQYIAGDDLSQMMAQKRTAFPPDQVLTWGDQLLDALDYLHTQDPQIIHRDIKPQNLKLTPRGQIILLDFGLAKGQAGEISRVTTSASIFGYTPNYAPLEQIQGLGTDPRSDIYALAATLYHLMTAVKPPDALSRAAALVNGQEDPLQPANEINGNIGPQVAAVLKRAMSQNRDQRYATAAEMRSALKATPEVSTLTGKAEAATLLFTPPATTVRDNAPRTVAATPAHGETTVVRAPSRSRVPGWAIGVAALVLISIAVGAFYAYQRRSNSNSVAGPSPTVAPTVPSASVTPEQAMASAEPSATKAERVAEARSTPKSTDKRLRADKNAQQPEPDEDRMPAYELHPPTIPAPQPPAEYGQPTGDRRLRRLGGGVTVETLPDGSHILTNPDGTVIVTKPNGTRRVIRAGQRFPRRRIP